ncbi:hypothetical protein ACQP1O_19335 [Nocardia sp. CA-151230]|uniref:hypothetical protein n=1 Tax=Nocardia sp. CA-151230 TaxID=3239982 RepID=UPI003D935B8C
MTPTASTSTLRVAALTALVSAGIAASATPAVADDTLTTAVNYTLSTEGTSVRAVLDGGTFAPAVDGQTMEIRDQGGHAVDAIASTLFVGDQQVPVSQRLDNGNRTLTLTPELANVPATASQPVASPFENQLAINDLATNMSRYPMIGTAVGALLGAVVGGVLGLGSCLVVGPACLATVPAAIAVFAAAGAMAGTVAGGVAGLIDGVDKYLIVLQSPPGDTPYAHNGLVDPDGTGVPDAILRLPSGSSSGLTGGSGSGSAPH